MLVSAAEKMPVHGQRGPERMFTYATTASSFGFEVGGGGIIYMTLADLGGRHC